MRRRAVCSSPECRRTGYTAEHSVHHGRPMAETGGGFHGRGPGADTQSGCAGTDGRCVRQRLLEQPRLGAQPRLHAHRQIYHQQWRLGQQRSGRSAGRVVAGAPIQTGRLPDRICRQVAHQRRRGHGDRSHPQTRLRLLVPVNRPQPLQRQLLRTPHLRQTLFGRKMGS